MRDDGWLVITVRDTGNGIEAKRLRTLFENFDEDEGATTSKYGGTGLGLPLSSKLCGLMGGDRSVESTLGKGSRFTARIPVSQDGRPLLGGMSGLDPAQPAARRAEPVA